MQQSPLNQTTASHPPPLSTASSFVGRTTDLEASAIIDELWSRVDEDRLYRALDTIPRFDPKFVAVEDFASSIQRTMSRVPPGHENRFLSELMYKLADPVRDYVEGKECRSVNDLLSLLKIRYARGYVELLLELERISMFPQERVIDYIHRATCLCHYAKKLIGEGIERVLKDVERFARSSFIRGLPPRISAKVGLLNPCTFDDACDEALGVERRDQLMMSYAYALPPRPPSSYDHHRRSEWRELRRERDLEESQSSYSAYTLTYHRDHYHRDPTPPRKPVTLVTVECERCGHENQIPDDYKESDAREISSERREYLRG